MKEHEHDIIIGLLILVIVTIQIIVFRITLKKIVQYKAIIPSQNNFKTIKVFIPESKIDTIDLKEIYMSLDQKHIDNTLFENKTNKDAIPINPRINDIEKELGSDENINLPYNIKVEVSTKKVVLNQPITVKYSMNKEVSIVAFKPFEGFEMINKPKLEHNDLLIDEKVVNVKSFTYMLKPIKTGILKIEKVSFRFKDVIIESKEINVVVKEA
ncbi:BatD family protein [Flavobacterium sp. RSSA_27]|uniref:BatD family protein n=1 Tax=Flavobacterium sp. RSSA_27 TaxID=3447667 RepID=UPI003F2CFD4F